MYFSFLYFLREGVNPGRLSWYCKSVAPTQTNKHQLQIRQLYQAESKLQLKKDIIQFFGFFTNPTKIRKNYPIHSHNYPIKICWLFLHCKKFLMQKVFLCLGGVLSLGRRKTSGWLTAEGKADSILPTLVVLQNA